jgi:hypothetical protein
MLYRCFINAIAELKPDFIRKLQDFEVKERESAILEVEISSETADVTWHKVSSGLSHNRPVNISPKHFLNVCLFIDYDVPGLGTSNRFTISGRKVWYKPV